MAHVTADTPRSGLRAQLEKLFAGFGNGFNAYLERRTRRDQIAELEAKSDAELAELGITRERIPQHVFRDLFYI